VKKLVLILLLVSLVVLGRSRSGGACAKQEYRALILAIAESPNTRVLETSYERGWLRSKSRTSFEIRGPLGESFQGCLLALGGEDGEEVRGRAGIRMRQTIEHGYAPLLDWLTGGLEGTPVLARVESHLELDKETQSEIAGVLGRLPPVSISTVIRVSGVGESSVTVPAARLEGRLAGDQGGGWAAQWEGLRGNLVYTTGFGHLAASFDSGGIEGGSARSIFSLRDLRWTADLSRDESGLVVGSVHTRVGSFQLSSREEGGARLEVDELALSQSSEVEAGSFGSGLEARVRWVRLADRVFGPGEVEIGLRNLDLLGLARLQGLQADALAPPASQDVTEAAAPGERKGPLLDLLSRSPQLAVRTLRLATPSGDLHASLHIALDGSRPELLSELSTLLLALEIRADLECPAEILDAMYRDREKELLELRQEGWVLLEGGRYRSRLELGHGELLVNGLPKSLDELPIRPKPEAAAGAERLEPVSSLAAGS
jgi:uncharacterized protein YdgA (DUF945 family)